MASAKARYYANQAKKGKITKAQASSAIAGKGLTTAPKVSTRAMAASANTPSNGSLGGLLSNTYANAVYSGQLSREQARDALNKQGANGNDIYSLVPDNFEQSAKYTGAKSSGISNSGSSSSSNKSSSSSNKSSSSSKTISLAPTNTRSMDASAFAGPTSDTSAADPFNVGTDYTKVKTVGTSAGNTAAGSIFDMISSGVKLIPGIGEGIDAWNKLGVDMSRLTGADSFLKTPDRLTNTVTDTGRVLGAEEERNLNSVRNLPKDIGGTPSDVNELMHQKNVASTGIFSPIKRTTTGGSSNSTTTNNNRGGNNPNNNRGKNPFDTTGGLDWSGNGGAQSDPVVTPEIQTLIDSISGGNQQQTETAPQNPFPQDGSMQYPTSTRNTDSGRGMGLYSNGGGLQGEDPYIREMRKSLGGYDKQSRSLENVYNDQIDSTKGQFEELIRSLDPTYDQYNKDAKTGVDEELNQNLIKLAAVMNANNTGDSEQRAQLMSSQQGQALAKLADLMQKLNIQKNQDTQEYRTKSVDALNSINQRKMDALSSLSQRKQASQQQLAQMMQQAQQQNWDNNYKMASLNGRGGSGSTSSTAAGSVTYLGDDAQGNPVYRNNKTGQREVGTGLTRKTSDPWANVLSSVLGQGGSQNGNQQMSTDVDGNPIRLNAQGQWEYVQ